MTGRDLIALTDARRGHRRKGRKPTVQVRIECRTWARRHQDVLRAALREPDSPVDLIATTPEAELLALGAIKLDLAFGQTAWTCGQGDDELVRRILGLDAVPSDAPTTPERYDGRHPGQHIVVRRKTDAPDAVPVYRGARS
jgi:hypothetical protein